MVPQNEMNGRRDENTRENIAYIRQMLGELRQVALGEGADMLCYLIEMAYVEAGDVQAGRRPRSFLHRERDKSPTCRCRRPARSSSSKIR
jgi:hypothetical protein